MVTTGGLAQDGAVPHGTEPKPITERADPPLPAAGHGRVGPENCSVQSALLHEPLPGTAPVARSWVLIEQPGPWGARALTESHFDPAVGAQLNAAAAGTGVRLGLIRRVGHHALAHEPAAQPGPRRVLVATTRPGAASVRSLSYEDPRELLALDLPAIGAGDPDAFARIGEPHPEPVLLVCTNGKRDRCCALLGRALAFDIARFAAAFTPGSAPSRPSPAEDRAAAAPAAEDLALPDGSDPLDVLAGSSAAPRGTMPGGGAPGTPFELWETDHLGGHRFAPTALVLPTGYAYGRLDVALARAAVAAAGGGEVLAEHCRGRSTWSRPGQAAELALREEIQEFHADAVDVLGERVLDPADPALAALSGSPTGPQAEGAAFWSVDLAIGLDRYHALVEERPAEQARPESCGKAAGRPAELRVAQLRKIN